MADFIEDCAATSYKLTNTINKLDAKKGKKLTVMDIVGDDPIHREEILKVAVREALEAYGFTLPGKEPAGDNTAEEQENFASILGA